MKTVKAKRIGKYLIVSWSLSVLLLFIDFCGLINLDFYPIINYFLKPIQIFFGVIGMIILYNNRFYSMKDIEEGQRIIFHFDDKIDGIYNPKPPSIRSKEFPAEEFIVRGMVDNGPNDVMFLLSKYDFKPNSYIKNGYFIRTGDKIEKLYETGQ